MRSAAIRTVIVDDEPLARRRIRTLLRTHPDFELVAECEDGPQAITVLERDQPDAVFLDVRMVEASGLDVARAVSANPPAIVFVTAYDEHAIDAFDVRAIDYLLKPFEEDRFTRALCRVRDHVAAIRARAAQELFPNAADSDAVRHVILKVGRLEVDLAARLASFDNEELVLRPKELNMLISFMRRPGTVVSREELLEDVWGYKGGVISRTIDTHLVELRRKMRVGPGESAYIETVARAGYRMRP